MNPFRLPVILLACAGCSPAEVPASQPTAGSQLFVDVLPQAAGERLLTVRLTAHIRGDRVPRLVSLPLGVSSPPRPHRRLNEPRRCPQTAGSI